MGVNIDEPEMLTVSQVANMLAVRSQTVRNWIAKGKIPATRITETKKLLIDKREVMDALEHGRIFKKDLRAPITACTIPNEI